LDVQVEELKKIQKHLSHSLLDAENIFIRKQSLDYQAVIIKDKQLRELAGELNQKQIERIIDKSSKTRLTILFYTIVGNAMMLSKQNLKLLEIFEKSFGGIRKNADSDAEFDLD
jgi:Na+/phosphate symporter